jgi:hypothetical protein
MVANATAEINPRNGVPPTTSARSGAAMFPPVSIARIASVSYEHHRTKPKHERQQIKNPMNAVA